MTKRSEDTEDAILDLPQSAILPDKSAASPMMITMIGAPFKTPRGAERSLRLSLIVPDGDVAKALATIRKNGGTYFRKVDRKGARWFLPWPPAAIRISPLPDAEKQEGAV